MTKKQATKPDELLSTEEAAKLAGKNAKTICRWFDAGLIVGEAVPVGSRIIRRVSCLSLEAHLKKLADQGAS